MRTIRRRRPAGGGEDGLTMIEVVVSMTIMSIFLAMFTTGILQIYRGTNKTEAITNAQAQLNVVLLRLDREIRYAEGISVPLAVGPDLYVEYQYQYVADLADPASIAVTKCAELRMHPVTKQLQRRDWIQGASPLIPSGWIPVASDVTAATPFTRQAADSTYNFQRLRLQVVASVGAGATAASKTIDITFGALNTSLATDSDDVCIEGRAVP